MILFAFEAYRALAATLRKTASVTLGRFRNERFENGELLILLETTVDKEDCLILGSIAPPDEQLLYSLLLAHTIRKQGGRRIIGMFPYLAYARHDKDKPGESLAAAWAGSLAQVSGIDQVITVDVHSERAARLFPIPVLSLSSAGILAEAMKRYGLTEATIVAPDEGAIGRCQAVATSAGAPSGKIAYFQKHRTEEGITHTGPIGAVRRQAVIIDDILDTGGTLLSACEKLNAAGAEDISIMVTHGLFTGARWEGLWHLGVRRIFCTDSVPLRPGVDVDRIVRLSIVPLLEKELKAHAVQR